MATWGRLVMCKSEAPVGLGLAQREVRTFRVGPCWHGSGKATWDGLRWRHRSRWRRVHFWQ